jgi:hypothetical protein
MPSLPIAAIRLSAAALFLAATAACAAAPAERDPLDPRAAVPPLRHSSALAGYRAPKNPAPTDWREANDTTAHVGGWRAYARQAQAGDAAPATQIPQPPLQPQVPPAERARHHGH